MKLAECLDRESNPVTLLYNIVPLKLKPPFVLNESVYTICVLDKAATEHYMVHVTSQDTAFNLVVSVHV